jgi:hypothetical protein
MIYIYLPRSKLIVFCILEKLYFRLSWRRIWTAFWNTEPWSFVELNWRFRSAYCPDVGDCMHLWNVGQLQRDYTAYLIMLSSSSQIKLYKGIILSAVLYSCEILSFNTRYRNYGCQKTKCRRIYLHLWKIRTGYVMHYSTERGDCYIRFEAFTATKYNKILPGFQPRQVVKSNLSYTSYSLE